MKIHTNNIRFINATQESGRVFFHTKDGATVVRTMTSNEVREAQVIRARKGVAAFNDEMCRLFNERYSEPQRFNTKPLSQGDARFFELRHYKSVRPLTPEENAEYCELANETDI